MADSKRSAILDAALQVFSEKGFHPATIDEIAERAGIGKGTVYSYFRSKTELMERLIELSTQAQLESAERRLAGLEKALDQLYALAALEREYLEQQEPFIRFLMTDVGSAITPEFRSAMEETRRRLQSIVADVIRRGQREGVFKSKIDADVAAIIILSIRAGILHHWHSREPRPEYDADAMTRQILEFILYGIASEKRSLSEGEVLQGEEKADPGEPESAGHDGRYGVEGDAHVKKAPDRVEDEE